MEKLRVLLVQHELSATGAPKVALTALQRLRDRIELRTVALTNGPLAAEYRTLGLTQALIGVPFPALPASLTHLSRYGTSRLAAGAKGRLWAGPLHRWRPDVIYVNSVLSLSVARHLRLPDAPVLLHVHELDTVLAAFSQSHAHLLHDLPTRYLAGSEAAEAALTRAGIAPDRIGVLHDFINEQDVAELPPRRFSQDGRLVVGGAGALNWCKGAHLWLLMAAELRGMLGPERVRFVRLSVPDTLEGRQFRDMAHKLGLDDCLEYRGFVADPLTEFAGFDVFAFTSWEDTCPLIVLENMAVETPVACFAGGGGAREEIGDTGIVVDKFSPSAMAAAIAALADAPAHRRGLGRAARARLLTHFTAAVQAPRLWGEFCRLVGRPSGE